MECLKPIYGCAADLVLLDCGKPVEGPDTLLSICRFVSMEFTPVYEEGTEIKLNDAKGRPCVDEAGCSYLSYYDVAIEMCGISATHTAWLSGDRLVPETSGAVFGSRTDCAPFFGMRVWQELGGGGRKLCSEDGEQQHLVHHFACLTDFRMTGSFTLGEDVTRQTMTAKAYPNYGTYGTGPWDSWTEAWFDEEIHGYQLETTPLPDCDEKDCALLPFVAPEGVLAGRGVG